jgi:methylglutaconyl-CoA hydratase
MENYHRLDVRWEHPIVRVALNRPEIHNAFDDIVIAELRQVFAAIAQDNKVRVMVLSGNGKSFCAGADMNWMRRMKDFNREENFRDSYTLSQMLRDLYSLSIPTVAKIQGVAVGGGIGLVAACDLSVAAEDAQFFLSEARLGLVPACIAPYLLKKINAGILRGYFLTGIRFAAPRAKEIGLIHECVANDQLDRATEDLLRKILDCGPQALKMAKELLDKVPEMQVSEWMDYTSQLIADLRASAEGQEGLCAFLQKREPSWRSG